MTLEHYIYLVINYIQINITYLNGPLKKQMYFRIYLLEQFNQKLNNFSIKNKKMMVLIAKYNNRKIKNLSVIQTETLKLMNHQTHCQKQV